MRLRLQFEKTGAIRFTSHKDIVRIFQRCFAACEIPMCFSEGFHPHMRMSFASPLKTGWASDAEYMDIYVERPPGPLAEHCNCRLPQGLRITHVTIVPEGALKLANDICAANYEVKIQAEDVFGPTANGTDNELHAAEVRKRIVECAERLIREDMPRAFDVEVAIDGDRLGFTYTSTMLSGRVVTPDDLVEGALGDPSTFSVPPKVRRLAQFVERDGTYLSPVDKGALQKL